MRKQTINKTLFLIDDFKYYGNFNLSIKEDNSYYYSYILIKSSFYYKSFF